MLGLEPQAEPQLVRKREPLLSDRACDTICILSSICGLSACQPLSTVAVSCCAGYKQLAALVHPDKCSLPLAEEAFKLLGQAVAQIASTSQQGDTAEG